MNNPWDTLSKAFDTNKDEGEGSADNIHIAWPPVLSFIEEYKPAGQNLRALDFGCGVGDFAKKLNSLGFQVTGVDSSEQMIHIAKRTNEAYADFKIGDSSSFETLPQVHIITAIMVLQFIEDIEKTITDFSKALLPGGIVVFAVHNQDHVKDYLHAKVLFEDFDSNDNPKKGFISLQGNRVPIFIRTAEEYNSLFKEDGFDPLFEAYPLFTEEFLRKYPVSGPTNHPRFLILGYKKR